MNYLTYSALDLAADEYFQSWVLTEDDEVSRYWDGWLETYPHRQAVVTEARQLLLLQQYKTEHWPTERKQAVLERIKHSVSSTKKLSNPSGFISSLIHKRWPWIAAAFTILLTIAIVWQITKNHHLEYRTGYGETQEVHLPDGSTVILNANSHLEFSENWQQAGRRQVWLEGEAFFEVNPIASDQSRKPVKFTVHVSSLQVEVIGTAFNVNHRAGNVDVFLDHGVVDIQMENQPRLRMKPGDMVNYSSHTRKLSKQSADSGKIVAWKQHQIILDNQPLSDLAEILQNYYGVQVDFDHPRLANRKVVAILPIDDLDAVLTTLETIGGVQAERTSNHVLFK